MRLRRVDDREFCGHCGRSIADLETGNVDPVTTARSSAARSVWFERDSTLMTIRTKRLSYGLQTVTSSGFESQMVVSTGLLALRNSHYFRGRELISVKEDDGDLEVADSVRIYDDDAPQLASLLDKQT